MDEYTDYYGFRGNISFVDQMSIFSLGLKNNSETKNKIFREFFSNLKESNMLQSEYQRRIYYLIYIQDYGDVYHCQLARRRQYDKFEMTPDGVIGKKDQDYPYVNIFIELESQKFFIQSNTKIYENYNTCKDVIQNIMNNNFQYKDTYITLNPIIKEEDFWHIIENEEVFNLQFMLCTPNMFDAEDDANNLLRDIEKNTNANHVNMQFSNSEGRLNLNKEGINSFIKYISAGAGKWKLKARRNGRRNAVYSSERRSRKIQIKLTQDDLNKKELSIECISKIKEEFFKIETIDRFKGDKSE